MNYFLFSAIQNNFRIKNFLVFCITAAFSIFAYIWLIIVLVWASPGKVEIWEAVLTFLFFPILVCVAYAGDKGYLNALLCQKNVAKLTNKQQQLELGNVQSGESKYIVPGQPASVLSSVVCLVGRITRDKLDFGRRFLETGRISHQIVSRTFH